MDPTVHANPYPTYRWLRENAPVYPVPGTPMYVAADTSAASTENTTAHAGRSRAARRCPCAVLVPRETNQPIERIVAA